MHHSELIITGSDGKPYEGAARQAILVAYLQEGRLPAEVEWSAPPGRHLDFIDWSGLGTETFTPLSDDAKMVLETLDHVIWPLRHRLHPEEPLQAAPHPAFFHFEMRDYELYLFLRNPSDSVSVRISGPKGLYAPGVRVECHFASRSSADLLEQIERCTRQLALLREASSIKTLLTSIYSSLSEERIGKVLVELATTQRAVWENIRKALAAQ